MHVHILSFPHHLDINSKIKWNRRIYLCGFLCTTQKEEEQEDVSSHRWLALKNVCLCDDQRRGPVSLHLWFLVYQRKHLVNSLCSALHFLGHYRCNNSQSLKLCTVTGPGQAVSANSEDTKWYTWVISDLIHVISAWLLNLWTKWSIQRLSIATLSAVKWNNWHVSVSTR